MRGYTRRTTTATIMSLSVSELLVMCTFRCVYHYALHADYNNVYRCVYAMYMHVYIIVCVYIYVYREV